MKVPPLSAIIAIAVAILGCVVASAQETAGQAVATFRSDVRLIEVYVTVLDHRGRYVTGLTRDRFEILDEGIPCPFSAFESTSSGFSCAILLDRTGSMGLAFPAVKNAILRFIDAFRENDVFALYSFNTSLTTLVDYTRDKDAAKQAVLNTIAQGATALFDSLSAITLQLSQRKGKKAVIVFTDGADNSSYLNANAVMRRARNSGIPVYAVAEGDALGSVELMRTLSDLSHLTGGFAYAVNKTSRIDEVFRDISANMQNAYMLAYAPPEPNGSHWRTIRVNIKDSKGLRIRAREGYYVR